MKKLLLAFTAVLLVSIYGCKEEDTDTSFCGNRVKDGTETEIDCGGSCEPCPAAGNLSCVLGVRPYNTNNTEGFILGPSIRVYANDGDYLHFMFVPDELGVETPIVDGNFIYSGESYKLAFGDSGTVVLTAHDTLRKIISGTFTFSANRTTGADRASALNGVFTNVRYHK